MTVFPSKDIANDQTHDDDTQSKRLFYILLSSVLLSSVVVILFDRSRCLYLEKLHYYYILKSRCVK